MGAAASSLSRPSKISSGKELLAQSKEVREMSNALFAFMFKSWSLKEVWEIANKPEDYVIALSELIEQQFHVIGYTTQRNQIGEIYFKQKDKLSPAGPGSPGYEKHKQNAQIIAFYFVRLFQIMGAMLLIVKDINFPKFDERTKTNRYNIANTVTGRPMLDQQLARFKYTPISQRGGGSFPKDIPLGPYEFLRKYLQKPSSEDIATYSSKFSADIKDKYKITGNLFFKYNFDIQADKARAQVKDYSKSTFYLLTKDSQTGSKVFKSKDVNIQAVNMGTGSLPAYKTPTSLETGKEKELYPVSVNIGLPTSGTTKLHTAEFTRIDPKNDDWSSGADYYISDGTKIEDILGRLDRKEFEKVIQEVVLGAIRQENPNLRIYDFPAAEASTKPSNVGSIPDKIGSSSMINELLQGLKAGQQPHCIARALQLLDSASIQAYSPAGATTRICKFAVGDHKSGSIGPVALDAYKPMKTVAQLFGKVNPANFKESQKVLEAFVGQTATTAPLGVSQLKSMHQDEEAAELAAALDRLAKAFEFANKGGLDSFSQIQVSRPSECKGNETVTIQNQQTTLQMQAAAQQLFAYHINQSIEISRFLKKIFNISEIPGDNGPRSKVEGPKAEILFAGFPVLDELTKQARALLIDYYSGCEEIYQGGLKAWKASDEVKSVPMASAPMASAPMASAYAAVPSASAAVPRGAVGGYRR